MRPALVPVLFGLLLARPLGARVGEGGVLEAQWEEYSALRPKTIIELQPFRQTSRLAFETAAGASSATLINLNPGINAWMVLTLRIGNGTERAYHLENPEPRTGRVTLDPAYPAGLRISSGSRSLDCALWAGGGRNVLEEARDSGVPYAPLCQDQLFLRNPVPGTYTTLERITNLLRDHVWGGDKIVGFIRDEMYQNAFVEQGATTRLAPARASAAGEGPRDALLADAFVNVGVRPEHLALDMGSGVSTFAMGRWYPVPDCPGVFLSIIQPQAIAPKVLASARQSVNALDALESSALDYLVAFDLSRFDLGFALGTDHPRVGWSDRVLDAMRDPRLPGPDGIGQIAPLVATGMLSPPDVARAAATFAGGFKREHGAFRYGALAEQNAGSHYGFIEQGTIFSKLEPGLATLFVSDTGEVTLKTWTRADDERLAHLRFARQNGVALIEPDANGVPEPGALVNRWGPGNWSGSSDEHLRTLRAGVCMQEGGGSRYLVYGYFSDSTPSAMARVFQAYSCSYAMHLDMNALEHTYLALYARKAGQTIVEHLIAGMSVVDRKGGDRLAPRFLAFPDDRDFFYLLRREPAASAGAMR